MEKYTFIKGIGNIVHTPNNYSFPHVSDYTDPNSQECKSIKSSDQLSLQQANPTKIQKLLNNQISEFFTFDPLIHLHRRNTEALQLQGVIITGYNTNNPYGTYCLNDIPKANEPMNLKSKEFNLYRFSKFPTSNFSIITQNPEFKTQIEIDNSGFQNFTTSAQVLSICTQDFDGNWVWSPSKIYPDGMHLQPSLTATDQYAQSGFEGMAAMVNHSGDIIITRPLDNAKRLQDTCTSIGIPAVESTQFTQSIKHAVLANSQYLPSPGSSAKMYIRPYVKAINGGTGVGPATEYLFGVQTFPFGDYIANRESLVKLVAIEGSRRSCVGGTGDKKYAGNYARTFLDKQYAKHGLIKDFKGQTFHDVFYFGETQDPTSNKTMEILEEDSAGNIFFISNPNNCLTLSTPSLDRGTILPGLTRDTVLTIAQSIGVITHEITNISWEDMQEYKGAFLTGSAAGIVRIASMSYKGQTIEFDQRTEEEADIITQTYYNLYDFLYRIRQGNTELFNDCPEITSIPVTIGNINTI